MLAVWLASATMTSMNEIRAIECMARPRWSTTRHRCACPRPTLESRTCPASETDHLCLHQDSQALPRWNQMDWLTGLATMLRLGDLTRAHLEEACPTTNLLTVATLHLQVAHHSCTITQAQHLPHRTATLR